ncbi:hypothetical protein JET14_01155 [Martelella lutilitoris]|uniref:Nuclear transport factor 2 family protein n=1 Tax=Martelella lutilitoris TaxID=2583532 RepID=A0A7T7KLM1_9HYPH|nr:hypothetical protein [Martelella lutilitoris]QQM30830.1 hypothetical protein JET14_01155 [Martelella lutilitoris]
MAITVEEVLALGERWCDTLREGGEIAEREAFFLYHPARIYVQESGASMTLEDHHAYHEQFAFQRLELGDFVIAQLSSEPERARAIGSLYWEAHFPEEDGRPPLRATVGEDWIVERMPDGELKFVLWLNTSHHFLPDSAVDRLKLD